MPFVFLLLTFLLYVQNPWVSSRWDWQPIEAILISLAGVGVFVVFAATAAFLYRHALWTAPYQRPDIMRRFRRAQSWLFIGFTLYFLASLYLLSFGWAVNEVLTGPFRPFVKLVVFLPYLLGLVAFWAFYHATEKAAHDLSWYPVERPFFSRMTYLGLHLRRNFLLIIAPLILMTTQETTQHFVPELGQREESPWLALGFLAALLVASSIFFPFFLRKFLGLVPLPPGELRDHLTATAQRVNFRFQNILVWDTRGTMANAMVTGMFASRRIIILTDRVIKDLTTQEIEAVFGHEVGHAKHHHLAFYAFFMGLSMMMLSGLWDLGMKHLDSILAVSWPDALPYLHRPEWFLIVMIVYIFLVFGLVSRHCERQADIYGSRVVSPEIFIDALEKVAHINGISLDKPGWFTAWQHWTIAERIRFLRDMTADPTLESRFQWRVGVLKWSLTLGMTAVIVVILFADPWSWLRYL